MTEFKIGDIVTVNDTYGADWEESDGSENNVKGARAPS